MHVLVVDDIPLNRDIAVTILVKENCTCDTAADGVEAVNMFKQKDYPILSETLATIFFHNCLDTTSYCWTFKCLV
jgi:CheY-like chemotaxis protein